MKHKTKQDVFNRYAAGIKAIREGVPIPRQRTKDGSIVTHPVVDVPDLPESEVVKECISWLRKYNVFCNRHDAGGGYLGAGTAYATYGIVGAGDIIGLLRNGRHFEIEIKRGSGGRLSKDQQRRKVNIENNNGLYFVVHGIPELEYLFKQEKII